MNERIKLLAEQARQYYLTLPTGFNPENVGMYPQLMEKFAELIVRECALTAGLMEHEGRTGIGAQILDNYGVAE
jgi:hypothetical protein